MTKETIEEQQKRFDLDYARLGGRDFPTEADRYRAEKVLLENHGRRNPDLIWVMEDDRITTIEERLGQMDELIVQLG